MIIPNRKKSKPRESRLSQLTLDRLPVLRHWLSANDRLDRAINKALAPYPDLLKAEAPRPLRLGAVHALLVHGRTEAAVEALISKARGIEQEIYFTVGLKTLAALSVGEVTRAANDLEWVAAQFELVVPQTLRNSI